MFEILSVNVREENSDEKRVRLFTWVDDINADGVFCSLFFLTRNTLY